MSFKKVSFWGLKLAISLAFFSAVADRFGLWGAYGVEGVVWGNFDNFVAYTQVLNPWAPDSLVSVLAWVATIAEVVLGLLLLTKFKTKEVAFLSGLLLSVFSLSMIFTVGLKAVFDYSVLTATFGAFYLAANSKA